MCHHLFECSHWQFWKMQFGAAWCFQVYMNYILCYSISYKSIYIYIMFLQSLKGLSDLTGKDVCWVSTLAVWPWWMFSTHKLDGSPQEGQDLLMKSLSSCCILRENPNMWWYQSNIIKLIYITFQITVETTTYLVAFRSFRMISPTIILGKWW